jgi:protein-S-isoprenylcysteine O-methyltransferase Ste14
MIDIVRLVLFLVLSAGAIVTSLHAWRTQQTYGYYRFFAFEAIVLLIVINIGHWFQDPFSIRQIASWILLTIGTVIAIHGAYLLRAIGRAQERVIEDTLTIVEAGAYKYIRHPLYISLMLLAWGIFFKGFDFLSGALAFVATVLLVVTSRYEERFNVDRFGTAYEEYMKRTKMFVPFLL